jgi:hypothetical protein
MSYIYNMNKSLTSTLVKIINEVYNNKNLNYSKEISINYLKSTKVKSIDRDRMVLNINNCSSNDKLNIYLTNCLLKFEGLGIK